MRHKNYKHEVAENFMRNEKGQVAIFVIVALIIVAIILILLFYPKIPFIQPSAEVSPISFLKSCTAPEIKMQVKELADKGGYRNPEGNLTYGGEAIKYLCYTAENYKTCVVQQPLIKENFEKELNAIMKNKISECVDSLKQEYEKRGYDVSLSRSDAKVSFNPGNILVSISSPMTVKKEESSKSFSGFNIEMESQMYDLLMLSVSIVDYEATYGDSETTLYMQYYPDLKIEKIRLSEGSKIYRLTNVITNETFSFASRSLVWPQGYGLE